MCPLSFLRAFQILRIAGLELLSPEVFGTTRTRGGQCGHGQDPEGAGYHVEPV